MGKDWLHWIVGGGGGGRSSARRGRRTLSGEMEESAGCMCAVFQLFDLHHFQLPQPNSGAADFHPPNIHPSLHEEATTSKGAEAPRNSLEEEEEPMAAINAASSKSLPIKEEEEEEASLNLPVGIQIKTNQGRKTPSSSSSPRISISCSKSRTEDFSSECSSNSPGIKTPSLVARLMGLDLLPECTSPSLSSSSSTKQKSHHPQVFKQSNRSSKSREFFDDDISGARSLPETPRVSSSRRSDVELYHHRLSLQINKENSSDEYFAVSEKLVARRGRRLTTMQQQDENVMIPGQYAKQIAKHVRESVSRRVGLDITNTSRSMREQHNRRDDENLILLKPTKKFSTDVKDSNRASSCSPRLRFLDTDKNKPNANSTAKSPRVVASSSSDNHTHNHHYHQLQQQQQKEKDNINVGNAGKCSSSRLKKLLPHQASDHTIRNKKEETFVHSTNKVSLTEKKSKRTPLSSDILNISSPTLLQIKRDPSPPPTKLPLKQAQVSDAPSSKKSTQLSSKPSHSYNQPNKILRVLPDSTNGSTTTIRGGAATEYRGYIQTILERVDIINNRLTWYTPSHPIDPSIFHHVELFHPTTTSSAAVAGGSSILNHRCNRKLIFQLVNELLGEILRPRFVFRPSSISLIGEDDQFGLVDELCKKIDDFPQANCLVLEDIDSLIEKDLRRSRLNVVFEEEEKESIVRDIEGEIMEMLVRETVAEIGGCAAEEQRLTDVTW